MNLEKLKYRFRPEEIEFRVGSTNEIKENGKVIKKATQGLALPYVTNRAIQNRLDDVCGVENWCNLYQKWTETSQICGISICVDPSNDKWITKWDGAENTNKEPVKGGLSNSMKRAAVQWGIGRYLYDVPPMWVDVVPKGKSYVFKYSPSLPEEFLPEGTKNSGYVADVATKEDIETAELMKNGEVSIDNTMLSRLHGYIDKYHIDLTKILRWAKIDDLEQLTISKYNEYINILRHSMPGFEEREGKTIDISENEKRRLEELNKAVGLK